MMKNQAKRRKRRLTRYCLLPLHSHIIHPIHSPISIALLSSPYPSRAYTNPQGPSSIARSISMKIQGKKMAHEARPDAMGVFARLLVAVSSCAFQHPLHPNPSSPPHPCYHPFGLIQPCYALPFTLSAIAMPPFPDLSPVLDSSFIHFEYPPSVFHAFRG